MHIGSKSWDEYPAEPCGTVIYEITHKFKTLEWVPYYNPTDSDEPPSRAIVENPITFQNIWPGAIRLPADNFQAALGQLDLKAQFDFRQQINYWKAQQKLFLDCGWGTEAFDGELYGRRRAEWIPAAGAMLYEYMTAMDQYMTLGESETEQQKHEREAVYERCNNFFRMSAGDHAV